MPLKYAFLKVCAIALLAVVASGLLIYQENQNHRHAIQNYQAEQELYRVNRYVEKLVQTRQQNVRTITLTLDIPGQMQKGGENLVPELNHLLHNVKESLSVEVVYLLDHNGVVLFSSNYVDADSFIGHNFESRYYFRQAKLGLPAQQIGLGLVTGEFGAYFAQPIIKEAEQDDASARFMGALVIKDSFDLPLARNSNESVGELATDNLASLTLLLNTSGEVASSNDKSWIGKKLAQDTINLEADTLHIDGTEYYATSTALKDFPGWHIIRLQPASSWVEDAFAPLITHAGIVYLAMLAAVFVAMLRLYKRVATSIRKREISHRRLRLSHQRYRRLSYRDPLTSLSNRRAYENDLRRELQRADRYHHPLSVALLDIDFFKKINDQHGHDVGDRTLKYFADLITNNIRETDMAYRFGGEEFILLLPETPLAEAELLLGRIQNALAGSNIEVPFTFSCGITDHRNADTPDTIFERADTLLYHVKENGRNAIKTQESH